MLTHRHEGVLKAEPWGAVPCDCFPVAGLNLISRSAGSHLRSSTSMPFPAVQIRPACRAGGHLGGVPFRFLGPSYQHNLRPRWALSTRGAVTPPLSVRSLPGT
jgi:hypothetical protein